MKRYLPLLMATTLVIPWTLCSADSNGNQPDQPVMDHQTPVAPASTTNSAGMPNLQIGFAKDQWDVASTYSSNLQAFGKYMKDHPGTIAQLDGFADHTGSGPANTTLAQKRTDAVAAYLIAHCGISASRIKAEGYGEVTEKNRNITVADRQLDRQVYGRIVNQ